MQEHTSGLDGTSTTSRDEPVGDLDEDEMEGDV